MADDTFAFLLGPCASPLSSPFLDENGLEAGMDYTSSDLSSPISSDYSGYSPSMFIDSFKDELMNFDYSHGQGSESFNTLLLDQNNKLGSDSVVIEVQNDPITVEPKEEKAKKGRGKKRSRTGESTDVSAVQLSKDDLKSFSSDDFDRHIVNMTSGRSLTFAEEKEVQNQRRKIKNRESAQQSRQRKKALMEDLETEITFLKGQNQLLMRENIVLKDELQKLRMFVNKSAPMANPVPKTIANLKSDISSSPQTKAKVGVCLTILLFSFGMFLNMDMGNIQTSNSLFSSTSVTPYTAPSRNILEFAPDTIEEFRAPSTPSSSPITYSEKPRTNQYSMRSQTKQKTTEKNPIKISDQDIIPMDRLEHEKFFTAKSDLIHGFRELMNESIQSNSSSAFDNKETQQWFRDRLKVRPNTAFYALKEFQQVIPPDMQPFDSLGPYFLTLLLPAQSLNPQLPNGSTNVDDSIVEVTCQILEINQTKLHLNEMNQPILVS